jgi:hypothetical protein
LEEPGSGSNPRNQIFQPEYKDNESSAKVAVSERISKLDVKTVKKLGFPGGAQPIFLKQLRYDPTVWNTCLLLLIELQSRNMLKLTPSVMVFLHFTGSR